MKQQIPEEKIYENFSVKAAEPLISSKGGARTDGLNYVTKRLKDGKKVTEKDVQTTLKSCINATTSPPLPVQKSCINATHIPSLPVQKSWSTPTTNRDAPPVQQNNPNLVKSEKPQNEPGSDPGPVQKPAPAEPVRPKVSHVGEMARANLAERPGFQRAGSGSESMNRPPISTQGVPRISRYPLLPRDQQDTATERFMKDCLPDKYHRMIREIRDSRPDLYPSDLDAICSAISLLATQEDE